MEQATKQDESFGVVPFSKEKGRWEVFIIQHNKSGYWGFPKGHAEVNESPQQAAFRELKEETNLELVKLIQNESIQEKYTFLMDGVRVFKRVFYFIAEVTGPIILQTKEIYDGMWLPIPEALIKVTHQEGKDILSKAKEALPLISI